MKDHTGRIGTGKRISLRGSLLTRCRHIVTNNWVPMSASAIMRSSMARSVKRALFYGPILETPQLGADWLLPTVTNAAIDAVIPAELKGKGRQQRCPKFKMSSPWVPKWQMSANWKLTQSSFNLTGFSLQAFSLLPCGAKCSFATSSNDP